MKTPPVAWIVVDGVDVLTLKYHKVLALLKSEGYLVFAVQRDHQFLHTLTKPEKVIDLGDYDD